MLKLEHLESHTPVQTKKMMESPTCNFNIELLLQSSAVRYHKILLSYHMTPIPGLNLLHISPTGASLATLVTCRYVVYLLQTFILHQF